ncbi:MAG TPA: sodium:solute symporter family protein [Clostridia bacterium]|nr:sodium:solute symporter family protein [Clostridia bacterium]
MEYAIVISVFLLALLLIGMYVSRKIKNEKDWMVAGQSLGVIPLTGTYFATIISSVSVVGYLGYYYNMGWGGWWNWAGTALTGVISAFWFARKIRSFGKVTLSDYIEERYGRIHGIIAAIVIFFAMIFFTSAQLAGSAAIITTTLGIDRTLAIIALAAIFILFTVMGGMESVAWTDTFCTVIIFVGVYALLPKAVGAAGGIAEIHQTLAQTRPAALDPFAGGALPLGVILSWIATWGIGNFGAPQFITRFNSAKDVETAEKSQGYCGILLLALYLPIMLIALSAIILFPGIPKPDSVTPFIVKELMNPWFGAVVMAGLLAASISTADSVLLLGSTTFVNDIYTKVLKKDASSEQILKISRLATVAVGVIAVVFTIMTNSTIMWIQANAVGFMGSMLAMIVLIGFAWKRANSQGAMAGMIVGLATAVIWYILGKPFGWFPILPSIFTSTLALVVVSLVTPPPPIEVQEKFFKKKDVGVKVLANNQNV